MMNFKNEEAVSPVIGVILMVAITVILAAVVAAFVFGMTDNIDPQKEVYATTTKTVNEAGQTLLIVTLQGGKDINLIKKVECIIGTNEPVTLEGLGETDTAELGKSGRINLDETGYLVDGDNHIIIRATFKDDSKKVLVETDHTYTA